MTKLIKFYFFVNTTSYLKKKKKNYNKLVYSLIKNFYIFKKNKLVNKNVSKIRYVMDFFNSSYGMSFGLFKVFFKKFITY